MNGSRLIDGIAIMRGALAGLVVIVPVTVARAVVSHSVTDFDHSGWAIVFFFAILLAYGLAGWVAGSSATGAPLTNGALAAFGAILLWLPLRIVIWAIRRQPAESERPPTDERRWRRPPRQPRNGPHGKTSREGVASRALPAARERAGTTSERT